MAFFENLTEFKNQPVVDWTGDAATVDFDRDAIRVRVAYDEASDGKSFADKLATLLNASGVSRLRSLVIGSWSPDDSGIDSSAVVQALVAARPKLTSLQNLFFGDIISEECEISWIRQTDLSPLLKAFDQLQHLTVRGGDNLSFGLPRHDRLRELVVQTGGLLPSVVHEISSAAFLSLEHLELYLGDPNYGGDATADDLAPLLRGDRFPKLRYLGLKDSMVADSIAIAAANAPILNQLETLDLSLGTLGDDGARALLASPAVRKLKKLDLHFHYVSEAVEAEFAKLGIAIDLSGRQTPHEYGGESHRFISVSE